MTQEEKALEFANRLEKQTIKCPRECLNPGLYFGYMAGYEAMKIPSDLALACKNMEIHELRAEKVSDWKRMDEAKDAFAAYTTQLETIIENLRVKLTQETKEWNETVAQLNEAATEMALENTKLRTENESIKEQLGDFYICKDDGRE